MSTTQRTERKTSRFRWTPEQFQKAAEDGWFGDRKVELLDGDVDCMVRNPLHRNCVWELFDPFSALLDKARWTITREDDAEMGDDWVPSPDVAVLLGNFDVLKDELLKGAESHPACRSVTQDLRTGSWFEAARATPTTRSASIGS